MNEKKCKALRRRARDATVGFPAVNYIGKRLNPQTRGVTVFLHGCTREYYKQLKADEVSAQ